MLLSYNTIVYNSYNGYPFSTKITTTSIIVRIELIMIDI